MAPTVVVVGAGLVGCVAAIVLKRHGYHVELYERSRDMRAVDMAGGRSINLVLTTRGMNALQKLGLQERVLAFCVPVLGRMMHDPEGGLTYTPYGKNDSECNFSVSRSQLNKFLLTEAESQGIPIHFAHAVNKYDPTTNTITFDVAAGSEGDATTKTLTPEVVVGCDGAGSRLRTGLNDAGLLTQCDATLLDHVYKEVTFHAGADGDYLLDKRALHIWARGDHMLMALANLDGSFTGTSYLRDKGEGVSVEALSTKEAVAKYFEEHFSDAVPVLGPELPEEFLSNQTGVLGTVRCAPWFHRGRVVLMGDAAHAIVPFFGQGLNSGLEDCAVFSELLAKHVPEVGADHDQAQLEALFADFSEQRKPNGDAIAQMALENWDEMRNHVARTDFLIRKRVESLLEKKFPTKYRSRYALVVYSSRVPYATALAAGALNDKVLDELCAKLGDDVDIDSAQSRVDLANAEALIDATLVPFYKEHGVDLLKDVGGVAH